MLERIIDTAQRARLLVVFLVLVVIGAGYWSYRQLPVDAFPDVSPNLVQVFTITEGLAPEEVEKYVTYPVEASMTGLPGVVEVRSISNFGLSVVNIYFEDGMDIYFIRQLVGERLQEAREQIPEGFGEPEMGPISTGMGQILYYYLDDTTGNYSLEELRTIQDWIVKYQLQTVPGVTEVLGIGGYEKQYHINIDPKALLRYNLVLHDVVERIEANNVSVGAQFIEVDAEEYVVRSEGLAHGIEDLAGIVVKTDDGRPIYLSDVAQIEVGGAIRRGLQTLNGQGEVVAGLVIQLYGTNASTVIERVEAKLKEVQKALPEGIKIVPYYQQRELVQSSVHTVRNALIQGIALVALVLLAFMGGIRPSIVVAPGYSLLGSVRHAGHGLLRHLGKPDVARRSGDRDRYDGRRHHRHGGKHRPCPTRIRRERATNSYRGKSLPRGCTADRVCDRHYYHCVFSRCSHCKALKAKHSGHLRIQSPWRCSDH